MPPRNPELPEGTDHIINGAMETGAGTDASTGSSGAGIGGDGGLGATTTGGGGGSSSGFIGGGDAGGFGDGTGGNVGGGDVGTGIELGGTGSSGGGSTGGSGGSSGAPIKQQVRDGAQSLKQQATDKVRSYAEDGKNRATTALDDFSQVVSDAAASIDERLGSEYGQYARRAADAVTGLADSLRNKEVDDLYDGARDVVRKSPGLAIGAAAVVGFTLVRLIKAGLDDTERDVEFRPDTGGTKGSGTSGRNSSATGV